MIQKAIHQLVENKNLDFDTTKEVMDEIMSGNASLCGHGHSGNRRGRGGNL